MSAVLRKEIHESFMPSALPFCLWSFYLKHIKWQLPTGFNLFHLKTLLFYSTTCGGVQAISTYLLFQESRRISPGWWLWGLLVALSVPFPSTGVQAWLTASPIGPTRVRDRLLLLVCGCVGVCCCVCLGVLTIFRWPGLYSGVWHCLWALDSHGQWVTKRENIIG